MRKTPTEEVPDWAQLLVDAVKTPGTISSAYRQFWNYSAGNQLLAWFECLMGGLQPGPIHTFPGWIKLGRYVKKGEIQLQHRQPHAPTPRHPSPRPLTPHLAISDPTLLTYSLDLLPTQITNYQLPITITIPNPFCHMHLHINSYQFSRNYPSRSTTPRAHPEFLTNS